MEHLCRAERRSRKRHQDALSDNFRLRQEQVRKNLEVQISSAAFLVLEPNFFIGLCVVLLPAIRREHLLVCHSKQSTACLMQSN
jgi:hypothetical protein